MKIHHLKTWPEFYHAIWRGAKRFEIRKNDRDFKVGDELTLEEWDHRTGYSGRKLNFTVTWITDFHQEPGYVVMSIDPCSKEVVEK